MYSSVSITLSVFHLTEFTLYEQAHVIKVRCINLARKITSSAKFPPSLWSYSTSLLVKHYDVLRASGRSRAMYFELEIDILTTFSCEGILSMVTTHRFTPG